MRIGAGCSILLLLAQLADKIGMCLTIPKKVIAKEENFFIIESPSGVRQKVKSLIDLKIGDFVLTQQNIVVEKIEQKEAKEILKIFKKAKKI